MDWSLTVIPVLFILGFSFAWQWMLKQFELIKPGWRKNPNFLSVGLLLLIALFTALIAGEIIGTPLGLEKLEYFMLVGVFQASESCKEAGREPVLGLECRESLVVPNPANYTGWGAIPFGENATCRCEWKVMSNE